MGPKGMESGSSGGRSGRSGRSGRRARGPLKSAEKPHPWAVDHEPMGSGAMGSVGGGWKCGWVGVGVGGWGWQGAYGGWLGVGVEQGPEIGPALAAMQVQG